MTHNNTSLICAYMYIVYALQTKCKIKERNVRNYRGFEADKKQEKNNLMYNIKLHAANIKL